MFYLEIVLSLTVIYWVSVMVAELILTSPSERHLPTVIRAAAGYMISVVWFGAAFKVVPIHWAWVAGLILLVSYTMSRSRSGLGLHLLELKSRTRSYAVSFVWYLLVANVFLLPLHMGQKYGPFTEGGGDVSIYADVSKYLTDRRLPAFGIKDVIYDFKRFAEDPLGTNADNQESIATFDEQKGNPPVADWSSYRVDIVRKYGSILLSPVAQWSFCSGSTNLPTFYASQAFQYSCLLLAIWAFFRPYGQSIALIALLLVASSHGIATVYYNVYFIQGISLMISGLVFYFAQSASLSSIFSVRAFGFCLMYVAAVYLHYASVIVPLLFVPVAVLFISRRMPRRAEDANRSTASSYRAAYEGDGLDKSVKLLRGLTIAVFFSIVSLWLLVELTYELKFFLPMIKSRISSIASDSGSIVQPMLGANEPLLTMKWSSLFLGLLSQQHFEPLMHVPSVVKSILSWGVSAGVFALLLSFGLSIVFVWMVLRGEIADLNTRRLVVSSLVMYVVCLAVVVFHHFLVQSSLYTQAKGAQNVLVVVYVSMVIPIGIAYKLYHEGERKRWLKVVGWVSGVMLGVFAMSLLILRLIYALLIAYGKGRSSILESSYFSRAEEILREDKDAFVLVEPRISADTYLGIQPFAGARMLPTRYLALQMAYNVLSGKEWVGLEVNHNVLGSDVISSSDLGHLWTLSAKKVGTRKFMEGFEGGQYEWVTERLADVMEPRVLMFGHHYEAFYGERLRSSRSDDKGWFTFFRNGSAMMVIPAHAEQRVIEVRLQPRDVGNFEEMVKEVMEAVERETGGWSVRTDMSEGILSVRYVLSPSTEARLVPLVRYWGEFWMNVRLDDMELQPFVTNSSSSPGSVSNTQVEVFASPDSVFTGQVVTATWSGLTSSASDDWIGVFPVGGRDQSRVTFAFTGAQNAGTLELLIPSSTLLGLYELRLYAHRRWQLISQSKPFYVIP